MGMIKTASLLSLYLIAESLGIKVSHVDLHKTSTGLLGKADALNKKITLDYSLKDCPREHKCVLAEEIGHILYPPQPGHIAYHARGYYDIDNIERSMIKVTVAQDERKALDWATGVLMPNVEFWRAVKEGENTLCKLADWFDVTEWFVRIKIGYIRRKARDEGNKLKWGDIIKRNYRS